MILKQYFLKIFDNIPTWSCIAPGRVNLIGEHVDYNQGLVLPIALDLHVELVASLRNDDIVEIHALDLNQSVRFSLANLERKESVTGDRLHSWALYPAGVAWSLQQSGYHPSGMNIIFTSNIPIGAGLSSSAAVEVAFATLWQSVGGYKIPQIEIAQICQRAENDFVGVSCGLMDQFASVCGIAGHALYLDIQNLHWEAVKLPENCAVVIIDSGVRRDLIATAYNERRLACQRAVEYLKPYLPDIKSLRDISPVEFAAYSANLPDMERKRAEHVIKEIARVQSFINGLRRNDLIALGALLFAGHASLRDLYEVSHPALDLIVDISRHIPGVIGSRMTGAGFGGCTVHLVDAEKAEEIMNNILKKYQNETDYDARGYISESSQGARAWRA